MKYFFLIFTILLMFEKSSNAQQLNIEETIDYLKTQAKKSYIRRNTIIPSKDKNDSISITISEYGYVTIKTWAYRMGSTAFGEDPNKQESFFLNDFTFDYKKVIVKVSNDNAKIEIICIGGYGQNCIQDNISIIPVTNREVLNLLFDIQGVEKIKNAFDYLFELLKDDVRYNKKDDDPFAPDNYKRKILVENKEDTTQKSIKLKYNGSLSEISASICGISKDFIFDSGASDVTISSNTEKELIEKKLIFKSNYLTPGLYKLADGSIVKARRILIPHIKVGSYTINDVICCVNPSSDVQLLGKSFLNRFSKWTMNNDNHTLILEE